MEDAMHSLLILVSALSLGGCIVVDPTPDPGPGPGTTAPPRADLAGEPTLSLGPSAYPGYRVLANSSASIPGGDLGYLVTANGQGGYRVVWTDTLNSSARFSGTITVDGTFDSRQTQGFSGAENLTYLASNQISFDSVPGANVDGIDLVSSSDPIYLDGQIDGSHVGVNIYFTGAHTASLVNSAYDPVAFTSP
jgi:hypothetical protein